jgi:hypothetical protein
MAKKDEIKFSNDYDAVFMPQIGAIATGTGTADVSKPSTAVVKKEDSDEMALWGDGNDFPQLVIADVRKDPELPNLLDEKARLLYSGGLVYGKLVKGKDGTETLEPYDEATTQKIDDWLLRSNINRYLMEASKDLYWFYNVFPEIIMKNDRSEIAAICVQPAEYCRWSKQNPSTGLVDACYINANFPEGKATDKLTKKLAVIDPYYDAAGNLLLRKELNLIYPLSIPTPGSKYYQLADWNSIRESGWLEVSRAIPKFKKSYLEKQMSIKYHIEVSDLYWGKKYEGFDSKTPTEKIKLKKEEFAAFQAILAGAEKAGSNLFTAFITDLATSKEYSLWKVTVLNDKIQTGVFLEDGKDASLYKQAAVGVHPALVGTMPNSGMGGAGSNIREAYNLHMLKSRAHQDIILEPLYVVKTYNKWPIDMAFRLRNSFMNTLDKGSETTKTVA